MNIDRSDSVKSVRLAPDEITDYIFIRECEEKNECEEPETKQPIVKEQEKKEEIKLNQSENKK